MSELKRYFELKSGGFFRNLAEELLNVCVGRIPTALGLLLRWLCWRLLIRGRGWIAIERGVEIFGSRWIEIGKGVYIGERVILQGRPGGLKIMDRVRIMPDAVLDVYNYRGLAGSGIEIGKGAVIGISAVITGQGRVEIGEDVIIAPGVKIMPVNHNYTNPGKPIKEQGITAIGIKIKKGAWIGAGAIILDGVEIGENAVIGAGAVVNREVPERAVVVGNPAVAVRT